MADVFTYLDYRKFLKDYYVQQKKDNPNFSYRYFGRIAGLKTSSLYKSIIDGKRNMSPATIRKFIKGLKLQKRQAEYFENLVLSNQAKTDEDRDLYFNRLISAKPQAKLTGIDKDQYAYYTKPYFVIIREMVALPGFREDPLWIADKIDLAISPQQAEEAVHVLIRLGLLKRNKEGKLVHSNTTVITPPEIESVDIFNFQRLMINMSKIAMLKSNPKFRDFPSMTIPIPLESLEEIRKKIREFQKELAHQISNGPENFGSVFQLNIQLFPVTKIEEDEM